jgi:hypothetical protein
MQSLEDRIAEFHRRLDAGEIVSPLHFVTSQNPNNAAAGNDASRRDNSYDKNNLPSSSEPNKSLPKKDTSNETGCLWTPSIDAFPIAFPAIDAHVHELGRTPAGKMQSGSVLLFPEGSGLWKCRVKNARYAQYLWRTAPTVAEALAEVEHALRAREGGWRDSEGKPTGRK